jgi:hypothetical protein
MEGPRVKFSPSKEHRAAISLAAKKENRNYDTKFKDKISKRLGTPVYIYDRLDNLINTCSSILRLKKAYNLKMNHKTLYKHIAAGTLFNGLKFSLIHLNSSSINIPVKNVK